jgi:hypothetical protein
MAELVKSVDYRIDVIANMKPGVMPMSGSALSAARTSMTWLPANCGIIVIVINPFVGALLSTFKQLDRKLSDRLRAARTIEEARAIIARERAAKPPL